MLRPLLAASLIIGTPAWAQDDAPATPPPQRVRSILLYGDEACPKPANPEEIVVCANAGDSPYRIPKKLRERTPGPAGTSWVRRAELVDEVNRVGVPGSCSPVGSFGQSGCTLDAIRRWAEEKKAQKAKDAVVP